MKIIKIETFKQNQISLIILNVFVLVSLFLVHIIFLFKIGLPSNLLILTLAVRFLLMFGEVYWLHNLPDETGEYLTNLYIAVSIWLNIIFAFLASVLSETPDSHYSVLMIIPILQAANQYNLTKTVGIISFIIFLTFFEIWIFFQQNPPVDFGEMFEAGTVSLIFLVVGFVVWLLIRNLRSEEDKLNQSLKELRQTQSKLVAEEKFAAIGQLSGAIAHEIRNPVAMISSSLRMAARHKEDSTLFNEMFEIAAREADRLETLTGDFLAYARSKEPERKDTNIDEILEYVECLVGAKAKEQNIELTVDSARPLTASIDRTQIQQALLNLLTNAFDETPLNGKIRLGAEYREEEHLMSLFVENSGKPVPDGIISNLFEPFITGKTGGTGLGLAIVRKIARMHDGDAFLAENFDGCVRFEILIPG